ncbi:MAG: DMT family transporter [Desulfamplus sp.]|nr:DMT family transporter [Desulfamplus sp.]
MRKRDLKTLKFDLILLFAAAIWGFAFVAQRMGMDHVGPYTFNGLRFALGALTLLPFLILSQIKRKKDAAHGEQSDARGAALPVSGDLDMAKQLKGGILAGIALFAGASFQQVGLVYTTAGKAGFITGLYVVIVPIIGLLWREKTVAGTWLGAGLASVGLYFLSVGESMTISHGDFLVLMGAFCFAAHVIIVGKLASRMNTLNLSIIQSLVCSAASLAVAVALENITLEGIRMAAVPIFYGGAFSVGIAYSLQIYGQKGTHPANAAIILSLESVFAAIGGWFVLSEVLSGRALMGCAVMLAGMLLSQLYPYMVPLGRDAANIKLSRDEIPPVSLS